MAKENMIEVTERVYDKFICDYPGPLTREIRKDNTSLWWDVTIKAKHMPDGKRYITKDKPTK